VDDFIGGAGGKGGRVAENKKAGTNPGWRGAMSAVVHVVGTLLKFRISNVEVRNKFELPTEGKLPKQDPVSVIVFHLSFLSF
jgi:hypothetical protein